MSDEDPLDQRLQLRPSVSVDPPLTDGAPWILSIDRVPHARLGDASARLLGALDGVVTVREAAARSGVRLESDAAAALIGSLIRAGALGSRVRRNRRTPRLVYRRPLSLQLSLGDPSAVTAQLARGLQRPRGRRLAVLIAAGTVSGGLFATGFVGERLIAAVSAPVPADALLGALIAVFFSGFVHEFAHGVTLSAFGGRPTRLGLMLFYFTPAFFCDVTDGWRLGRRRQRASVALAGPAVHLTLAAALTILSVWLPPGSAVADGVAVTAVAFLGTSLANLIPFVKLDGYLALVAMTDVPNLRRIAMSTARERLVRALVAPAPRSERHALLIAYGFGCGLFPIALLGALYFRLSDSLVPAGRWGALIALALTAAVLVLLLRPVLRFALAVRAARPSPRRAGVAALVLLLLAAALGSIPLPQTRTVGFTTEGSTLALVGLDRDELAGLPSGARVELRSNGVVLHPLVGRATLLDTAPAPSSAPLTAFVPVAAERTTPVFARALDGSAAAPAGVAVVDLGATRPLAVAAADRILLDPLRRLLEGMVE